MERSWLLKRLHTKTPYDANGRLACLRETSLGDQETVSPIYGVKQRTLLPLLENVISPSSIGLILDVDLVIAEIGLPPLFANDRRELGK